MSKRCPKLFSKLRAFFPGKHITKLGEPKGGRDRVAAITPPPFCRIFLNTERGDRVVKG